MRIRKASISFNFKLKIYSLPENLKAQCVGKFPQAIKTSQLTMKPKRLSTFYVFPWQRPFGNRIRKPLNRFLIYFYLLFVANHWQRNAIRICECRTLAPPYS